MCSSHMYLEKVRKIQHGPTHKRLSCRLNRRIGDRVVNQLIRVAMVHPWIVIQIHIVQITVPSLDCERCWLS